eukprot:1152834-Pelagomonas_calceolata.AAC.5
MRHDIEKRAVNIGLFTADTRANRKSQKGSAQLTGGRTEEGTSIPLILAMPRWRHPLIPPIWATPWTRHRSI